MKVFKTGLCVVAAGCLVVQGVGAEPRLVVSGVVTDIETGKPIEGARVADDDYGPEPRKGAITGSEGKYSYTTWGEEHNVVARAVGYKPKQKLLTTNPLQTNKGNVLNFELSPKTPYATPVSVLLEQGIYTEETVGDLDRAIEIYAEIVDDDQANQKYVAEALFRMGRCHVASGQNEIALEELQKLTKQFADQKKLVERAGRMIAELVPKPLFPELENCRLKYPLSVHLGRSASGRTKEYTFYGTDMVELSWSVGQEIEGDIDRFEVALATMEAEVFSSVDLPETACSLPTWDFIPMEPGWYSLRVVGYGGSNEVARSEVILQIEPIPRSQIGLDEIMPNLDIRFSSVQQSINNHQPIDSRGFINSDFVHIEAMFDGDGEDVEFTEAHEGNIYRYRATLNKPVATGEIYLLGSRGWKEGMVKKVPGSDHEYQYRMNHTPGGNAPTRRVEIFRLPHGAELLETTPADLPHHVLEDGRVEILVDTIIPTGGSLLTEFRYRLAKESDKYVAQISALKKKADSSEKLEALERIGNITANATFHQGALVELAKLAAEAPRNHQRIVKAAELASQFGYHTGALIEVAKIAVSAEHECAELDEILELVVLKLGGTPQVVQLARDAVEVNTDDEMADARSRIAAFQQSADYQTLEEALEGQKTIFDPASKYKALDLQPAPWPDGEVLRYRLLAKTGVEMGNLIWAVNGMQQDGKACWKIEQRLVIPSAGTMMASQVVAGKEDFAPLTGRTSHSLGTVSAQYLPGKVLLSHEGAQTPREVETPEPIFDNEQVLYLMRCLPLKESYKAEFPIMSILSGMSSLDCRIRVMGREQVDVASETHDCWKIRIQVYAGAMKAVEQTTWFAIDGHVPVRFVTDQMDMELAEHTGTAQKAMELKEHGTTVHLPAGWFGYELPAVGKGSETVRLMPPDMKLEGMLCKTLRQPLTLSVQEIATTDIEVLKVYSKNYAVRDGSVVEKEVHGIPTYIYAADYEDQGKAKVEYRAYYVAGSRVFWFVFRMNAEQFGQERAALDAVIEGLSIFLSPEEDLQTCVRQFLQSNWRDLKTREDIEWGTVQEQESGNRSIRYKYKARIWDGEMQIFEDTFTFDDKGKYIGVERTEGYPMPLDEGKGGK